MFGVIYVSYLPGVLPCAVCFLARAAWLTSRESLAHCCCFKIFIYVFVYAAASDLSCRVWALELWLMSLVALQHVGS